MIVLGEEDTLQLPQGCLKHAAILEAFGLISVGTSTGPGGHGPRLVRGIVLDLLVKLLTLKVFNSKLPKGLT